MANSNSELSCARVCWLAAAGIGLIALIIMLVFGSAGAITSLFIAGVIFVVLGLLFGYLFCRDASPLGGGETGTSAATPEPEPEPKRAESASSEPTEAARTEEPATPAAPAAEEVKGKDSAMTTEASADTPVKSGTQLPGEEELSGRKGEWAYQGDRGAGAADEPAAAPASPSAPETPQASGGGAKPEGLAQARGGQPDDLKQIKGVGPKLEKLLHSKGFFHFDQIAAWGPEEVAWVDENLKGFKGRVTRDDWVEQAKILASGGETEFSKRARDGDVY